MRSLTSLYTDVKRRKWEIGSQVAWAHWEKSQPDHTVHRLNGDGDRVLPTITLSFGSDRNMEA